MLPHRQPIAPKLWEMVVAFLAPGLAAFSALMLSVCWFHYLRIDQGREFKWFLFRVFSGATWWTVYVLPISLWAGYRCHKKEEPRPLRVAALVVVYLVLAFTSGHYLEVLKNKWIYRDMSNET